VSVEELIAAAVERAVERAVETKLRPVLEQLRGGAGVAGEYLSVQEAAALAGVHAATVRGWIAQGLRTHGQGRIVRIRRDDLVAFMREGAARGAGRTAESDVVSIIRGKQAAAGGGGRPG